MASYTVDIMTLKFECIIIDHYMSYCKHGKTHRTDGPAVMYDDGDMFWYQYGLIHRTDDPAIIYNTGSQYWYIRGKHKII
jgi:hypothetical protein